MRLSAVLLTSALAVSAAAHAADSPPTVSEVNAAGDRAKAAFEADDCPQALPLLRTYADQADRLGSILRRGIEPFTGASREAQDRLMEFSRSNYDATLEAWDESDRFLLERDTALVMQAECLLRSGQSEEAFAVAFDVVERIPIGEGALWRRAQKILWQTIGYSLPEP